MEKNKGKKLKGEITSNSMDKTVVVLVNRFFKHKQYGKFVRISKKYKAHDENNEYKKGEKVIIKECRPLSKDKHFKVIRITN